MAGFKSSNARRAFFAEQKDKNPFMKTQDAMGIKTPMQSSSSKIRSGMPGIKMTSEPALPKEPKEKMTIPGMPKLAKMPKFARTRKYFKS